MAHDGPIDPCVWMANSYVAWSRLAAPARAALGSPLSIVTSSLLIGVDRTCSYSLLMSGKPSHDDHVALSWLAAFTAAHSLSATTARKLACLTTFRTPLIPLTDDSSTLRSSAPTAGGRTTRAWSMPGTRTSCMYVHSPVTFAGISTRGADVPTTVYSPGFLTGAFLSTFRRNSRSPMSSL